MATKNMFKRMDRVLIEKVGKYYFEYKNILSLANLDQLLGDSNNEIKNGISESIRARLIFMAVNVCLDSAKDALKDSRIYREFTNEVDTEIQGPINIPISILTFTTGRFAYTTTKSVKFSLEYSVLGAVMKNIISLGNTFIEEQLSADDLFDSKEELSKKLEELLSLLGYFPVGYIRRPSRFDSQWLENALNAYYMLNELRIGVKTNYKEDVTRLHRLITWKLYELFLYYLVIKALEADGYNILNQHESYIVAQKDGEMLNILFNVSIDKRYHIIDKIVNSAKPSLVDELKGRPDISFDEKNMIIEYKYSTYPAYITAGRFKVLAYMYEYNLSKSFLVFPSLKKSKYSDSEDNGTAELYRLAQENSGKVKILLKNDKELNLLIIDPREDDKTLVDKIKSLL